MQDDRVRRLATVAAGLSLVTSLLYGGLLYAGGARASSGPPGAQGQALFSRGFPWILLAFGVLMGMRFAWSYLRVARRENLAVDDETVLRVRRSNAVWCAVVLSLVTIAMLASAQFSLVGWAVAALIAALGWVTCAVAGVRAARHLL